MPQKTVDLSTVAKIHKTGTHSHLGHPSLDLAKVFVIHQLHGSETLDLPKTSCFGIQRRGHAGTQRAYLWRVQNGSTAVLFLRSRIMVRYLSILHASKDVERFTTVHDETKLSAFSLR
jgi:hypothetical protein